MIFSILGTTWEHKTAQANGCGGMVATCIGVTVLGDIPHMLLTWFYEGELKQCFGHPLCWVQVRAEVGSPAGVPVH